MGHHMSSAAQPASRAELARAWADAVSPATEVPLPRNIIEQCLLASVDQLVDALREEPFYPECGADAATALVARALLVLTPWREPWTCSAGCFPRCPN
jgi:hypothetical protein